MIFKSICVYSAPTMIRIFLFLVSISVFGLDVKQCIITDASKHEANQRLLHSVLNRELSMLDASMPVADQLLANISQIAEQLLQDGFDIDAYGVQEIDERSIASYHAYTLWEGEEQAIPLTFFIYVWPREEYVLSIHSSHPSRFPYGTKIHSHPISCGFAVLEGTLIQNNYEQIHPTRSLRWAGEDTFGKTEGDIDLLAVPFIHQVYAKGIGSKPAISLHAYGLPTAAKVRECFARMRTDHFYE
jgi:hypothetical protein